MVDDVRYGVEELAELGGVSRRTVRYYVQEKLLPEPLGVGRGRHYGAAHLRALLRVRELQEQGWSLERIREDLAGRPAPLAPAVPRRTAWTRVELLPGVELAVATGHRLPGPGALQELAEWCRRNLRRSEESDD